MASRSIVEATSDYEAWLEKQTPLIKEDIAVKHAKMATDPFQFMRATFYRWCELWPELNPELAAATKVLGVGDLHIQNFGTWRDTEGRLVWGVNDFDEASTCSFANDLVRVAASARLAAGQDALLLLTQREVAELLLEGYQNCLQIGGRPVVLDRRHPWLLRLARVALKEPREFWNRWLTEKTSSVPNLDVIPKEAQKVIFDDLPGKARVDFRWKKKGADPKGLGSLGHMRFFGLIDWQGGPIVRETKASALSAWLWAAGKSEGKNQIIELINAAIRSRDPYVKMEGDWLIRPIAADCGRIDLDELDAMSPDADRRADQIKLIRAMGFETANIHLGTVSAEELAPSAKALTPAKLREAALRMLNAISEDFAAWKKAYKIQRDSENAKVAKTQKIGKAPKKVPNNKAGKKSIEPKRTVK
jgi:hypothetical protein